MRGAAALEVTHMGTGMGEAEKKGRCLGNKVIWWVSFKTARFLVYWSINK